MCLWPLLIVWPDQVVGCSSLAVVFPGDHRCPCLGRCCGIIAGMNAECVSHMPMSYYPGPGDAAFSWARVTSKIASSQPRHARSGCNPQSFTSTTDTDTTAGFVISRPETWPCLPAVCAWFCNPSQTMPIIRFYRVTGTTSNVFKLGSTCLALVCLVIGKHGFQPNGTTIARCNATYNATTQIRLRGIIPGPKLNTHKNPGFNEIDARLSPSPSRLPEQSMTSRVIYHHHFPLAHIIIFTSFWRGVYFIVRRH